MPPPSTPSPSPQPAAEHFSDRLADAIDRAGSPACVGLDPVVERLPTSFPREGDPAVLLDDFCRGVLDAIRPHIPIVKFQSACFERYGAAGVGVLRNLIRTAHRMGFLIILDAKRGDIGITAEHYAAAAFGADRRSGSGALEESAAADALTISGYLGPDTVEPFLKPGAGVFVLVRTSNPGSDAVQAQRLADGRTVAELIADQVVELGRSRRGRRGLSDVGAVVGATKASEGRTLRGRMADQVFLVPGYGAQGGTLEDVRAMLRPGARSAGDLGVIVTASRSVIYAYRDADRDWTNAVRDAAGAFADELRSLAGPRT